MGRVVVRIIARLNIGGPARHCAVLAEGLAARGHRTILVHGTADDREGSLADTVGPGAATLVLVPELGRRIRPWSDLTALVKIVRVLAEHQPDVVHTHTAKAGALGRVAALVHNAGRGSRRALVVHTYHGHVFEAYFGRAASALVRGIERALSAITDRVVTISPTQRADIVERFHVSKADRTVVIPLGLDLDAFARPSPPENALRRELAVAPGAFVIGFVGRLVPVKAPGVLLDAFERVIATEPDVHLVMVGDGPLREAVAARAASWPGRVHLLGWRKDLAPVYAGVDAVALSSDNEGTPVALIEAMAARRAVAATSVGGVPDVVEDGVTGLLVPRGDAQALARVLARLASDAALRQRLGEAAHARVMERFGAARLVRDIDALYEEGLHALHEPRR